MKRRASTVFFPLLKFPAETGSLGWKYWRIIDFFYIKCLYVMLQSWTMIFYLLAYCREKDMLVQIIWLDKNRRSAGWAFSSTLAEWFPTFCPWDPSPYVLNMLVYYNNPYHLFVFIQYFLYFTLNYFIHDKLHFLPFHLVEYSFAISAYYNAFLRGLFWEYYLLPRAQYIIYIKPGCFFVISGNIPSLGANPFVWGKCWEASGRRAEHVCRLKRSYC